MAGTLPAAGADRVRSVFGATGSRGDCAAAIRKTDILLPGCGSGARVVDRTAMAAFEAIAVKPSPDGRDLDLVLVHPQPGLSVVVGCFGEDEIVARWRAFAAASGLPLAVDIDGVLEKPYPQIGRLRLGPIRIRRGHGLLAGRRPRFLLKRKTTRLPLRPTVHREREMVGR